MHERGKSDNPVVPAKLPNNAGPPVAEAVEERGLAKENTASTTRPGRSAGPGVSSGLDRVREIARRDKDARFTALLHHVDFDRLRAAYWAIRPQAAPGVDGVTWAGYGQDLEANLRDLHARVHSGAYRASPSRRVYIPKADGRQRPLGIATVEDKVLQRAVVEVLNAVYEVDFLGFSYGFRPGRGPHDALDALTTGIKRKKVNWVLDADIRDFLKSSTHCSFRRLSWLKQLVSGCRRLHTQALSAATAHVDGAQLPALYTLHDRLARHPVGQGCLQHGEPARRGVIHEQRPDGRGEADAPGRPRRELLAGHEPVVEPSVEGGRRDPELGGGVGHGERLSFLRVVGGSVVGDSPVVAQALDSTGGVRQPPGGAASLAVEDAGDLGVGVVHGQAAEQGDGVLVGADRWRPALQGDGQVAGGAALPAQDQVSSPTGGVPGHRDAHLLEQAAEQLLALAVGGARRVEDGAEVVAQGEDGAALAAREGLWPGRLPAGELPFGSRPLPQGRLPGGFQAPGDEAVLGLDRLVAPLGLVRRVPGPLGLAPPLVEGGIVALLELGGRGQAGLEGRRLSLSTPFGPTAMA